MVLVFQTIRSTAIPLMGAITAMRSALRLGLAHRVLRAVAADLEDLQVGLGRLAFEGVGGLQLIERRDRLLDSQVVLLGLNSRQQLVLDRLELGARERALGLQDLAVVARLARALAGVLLLDLLIEVVQLGAAVEGGGQLVLAVEFDEEVTLLDRCAGLDELGNDEGLRIRPGKPGALRSSSTPRPRRCRSDRTERTKSCRVTVAVVWRRPDCPDSEFPGSRPRISAAPRGDADEYDRGSYPQARVALGRHRCSGYQTALLRCWLAPFRVRHHPRDKAPGTLNRDSSRVTLKRDRPRGLSQS